MARPKKIVDKIIGNEETVAEVLAVLVPTSITKLSIDYPTEQLNDMARKINEIIDRL